jgi:hypothetical protein
MTLLCTHCSQRLVEGPCVREGDSCCTHEQVCPEHGRQYVTSWNLLLARAEHDRETANRALPLFSLELSA